MADGKESSSDTSERDSSREQLRSALRSLRQSDQTTDSVQNNESSRQLLPGNNFNNGNHQAQAQSNENRSSLFQLSQSLEMIDSDGFDLSLTPTVQQYITPHFDSTNMNNTEVSRPSIPTLSAEFSCFYTNPISTESLSTVPLNTELISTRPISTESVSTMPVSPGLVVSAARSVPTETANIRTVETTNRIDIVQLMDNNRQLLDNNERLLRVNSEEIPIDHHTLRVPNDSFSDTTETEEEYNDMNICKRPKKPNITDGNVPVPHPLCIKHTHCHKDAALSSSQSQSEPDQLISGTKYVKREQRVPYIKKRVLQRLKRESLIENSSEEEHITPPLLGPQEQLNISCQADGDPQSSERSSSEESVQVALSGQVSSSEVIVNDAPPNSHITSSVTFSERAHHSSNEISNSTQSQGIPASCPNISQEELFSTSETTDSLTATIDSQYDRANQIPEWMLHQSRDNEVNTKRPRIDDSNSGNGKSSSQPPNKKLCTSNSEVDKENESEPSQSSYSGLSKSSSSGTDSGYLGSISSTGSSSSAGSIPLTQPTPYFSSSSSSNNSNNNNNGKETSSSVEYSGTSSNSDSIATQGDDEESGTKSEGNSSGGVNDGNNSEGRNDNGGGNERNSSEGGSNSGGGNEENNNGGGGSNFEEESEENNSGEASNGGGSQRNNNRGSSQGNISTEGSNRKNDIRPCDVNRGNGINYQPNRSEVEKKNTDNAVNWKLDKEDKVTEVLHKVTISEGSSYNASMTSEDNQSYSVFVNDSVSNIPTTNTPIIEVNMPPIADAILVNGSSSHVKDSCSLMFPSPLCLETQSLSAELVSVTETERITIKDTQSMKNNELLILKDSFVLSENTSISSQLLQDNTPLPHEDSTLPCSSTTHESSIDSTLPTTEVSSSIEHVSLMEVTDSPSLLDIDSFNKSKDSKNISQEAMTTGESSHLSFHLELTPTQNEDNHTVQDSPIIISDSSTHQNTSQLLNTNSFVKMIEETFDCDQNLSCTNIVPLVPNYESVSSYGSSDHSISTTDNVTAAVVIPTITLSTDSLLYSNTVSTDIQPVLANTNNMPETATILTTSVIASVTSKAPIVSVTANILPSSVIPISTIVSSTTDTQPISDTVSSTSLTADIQPTFLSNTVTPTYITATVLPPSLTTVCVSATTPLSSKATTIPLTNSLQQTLPTATTNQLTSVVATTTLTSVVATDPLTSITAINPPSLLTATNLPCSLAATNLTTSLTATNPPTLLTATNPPTLLAATNPSTSLAATNPSTSLAATNPPTSLTATNPLTSITAINPPFPLTATNLPCSLAATNLTTSLTATNPPTSLPATNPPTSLAATNPSITAACSLTNDTQLISLTSAVQSEVCSLGISPQTPIVIGRSPGKCLSLRRRRSNNEITSRKELKEDTYSDVQTINSEDNSTSDIYTNGLSQCTSNGTQSDKDCPPQLSAFVIGTNSEPVDEVKDMFNDSSQFEMPSIVINTDQPDYELSPFDLSLPKPNDSYLPLSQSLRPVPTGGCKKVIQKDQIRNDPFEFHNDHSPSTPSVHLSQQSETSSAVDNTENPLPVINHESFYCQRNISTVTSTPPGSSYNQRTSNSFHDNSRMIVSTPINHHTSISSQYFTSPSSVLTPQALSNLCHSHEESPFVQLKHVTMVTTTNKYVRTEVIDQTTGCIIGTHDEIEGSTEQQKTTIEVDSLNTLPSWSLDQTSAMPVVGSIINSSNSSISQTNSTTITGSTPTGRKRKASSLDTIPDIDQTAQNTVQESSSFVYTVNQNVIARWTNNDWYVGKLREVYPRNVVVDFYDGTHLKVLTQNLLPLLLLPSGIQVCSVDTDVTGSFIDCSIEDASFRMKLDNENIVKYSLEDLMITGETAKMVQNLVSNNRTPFKQVSKRKKVQRKSIEEKPILLIDKLFNGLVFLVTDHKHDQSSSSGSEEQCVGKEQIEDIIVKRGGFIMDDYRSNLVIKNKTFCVSNTYCRTVKYLTALAVNLPCVSYEWIQQCLRQNKIIDFTSFYLPAGISPITKELIQWTNRPKNFLNVSICIIGSKTFKEIWGKVTVSGGGLVQSKPPSTSRKIPSESQRLMVIITENLKSSLPPSLKHSSVPVVGPDWIVECLLKGQLVSTTPYQRF